MQNGGHFVSAPMCKVSAMYKRLALTTISQNNETPGIL